MAALASMLAMASPAVAEESVDLELVLAVDASSSMGFAELLLQRDGYVAAFRHPAVIDVIGAGSHGRIAVTYVEWAGPELRRVVVPWRILADAADAQAFAAELGSAPVGIGSQTSISGGLLFAALLFDQNGVTGTRRAIDVSGDGANNVGVGIVDARDRIVGAGITINGLPIVIRPTELDARGVDLNAYYQDCVIGGPGAFTIAVDDPAGFRVAIRRKLVLEIAGLPPRLMPAAAPLTSRPRVDCLIGEKMR